MRDYLAKNRSNGWQPIALVIERSISEPGALVWVAFLGAPLFLSVESGAAARIALMSHAAGWYRSSSQHGVLELLDLQGVVLGTVHDPRATAQAATIAPTNARAMPPAGQVGVPAAAPVAAPVAGPAAGSGAGAQAATRSSNVPDVSARQAFTLSCVYILRGLRHLVGRTWDFLRAHDRVSLSLIIIPALLVAVAALVPSPYVAESPRPSVPLSSLMQVPHPAGTSGGELRVALVRTERPTWLRYLVMRRNVDVDFLPVASAGGQPAAAGPAWSPQDQEFPLAAQSATVAALLQAKLIKRHGVSGSGVFVSDALPGLGVRPGDRIIGADGLPMSNSLDWQSVLDRHKGGDLIPVTVAQRPAGKAFVWLVPDLTTMRRRAASVLVEDRNLKYDLGFRPQFEQLVAVEGPSAGLVMGIDIYQSVTKTDLLRSRRIVVTGAIEASGDVGPIGGLRQKVLQALVEKPDIMLVPAQQADEAQRIGKHAKFPIIGVTSLRDAIEALALPTTAESVRAVSSRLEGAGLPPAEFNSAARSLAR